MRLSDRLLIVVGLVIGLVVGTAVSSAGGVLAQVSPPTAALGIGSDGVPAALERLAAATTVSVDSKGCAGPLLGSGVVAAGGLLITAAHVAGGAEHVTVISPEGRTEAEPVMVAPGIDVASAPVPTSWPSVREASADPAPGAAVVVSTRARGVLVVRAAQVAGYLRGTGPDDPPRVMRLDVGVSPGDSGGPVFDAHGRLVGIVYAAQHVTSQALVIPVGELLGALGSDGAVAAC